MAVEQRGGFVAWARDKMNELVPTKERNQKSSHSPDQHHQINLT